MVSYWFFELSVLVSLFTGGTITATSIGITVRVLGDINFQHSYEGEVVLGAAGLDDVLGVILLAVLYDFSVSGEICYFNIFKVMLFVSVFFVVAAKFMSVYKNA